MGRLSLVASLLVLVACSSEKTNVADSGEPILDLSTAAPGDGGALESDAAPANDLAVANDLSSSDLLTSDSTTPSVTGIVKVAAGEYVTSFLKNGRLYILSTNPSRRGAGDITITSQFPPVEVAFPSDVKIVDAVGGLHFSLATDDQGRVWEWGDIEANPDLVNSHVPVQITTNAEGQPFTLRDNAGHTARAMAASITTSIAVAGDGSVWIWDDCSGGLAGDGTDGSASVKNPLRVAIPLPSGVTITKVALSDVALALASDGTVWAWGGNGVNDNLGTGNTDYKTPHVIATTSTGAAMPPIVEISTSNSYSYALSATGELYAWGFYAEIAGLCPGSGFCPKGKPVLSTQLVPKPVGTKIVSIATNTGGSYAILDDGTLWGWGTNGQGLVGNGDGPDWTMTTMPYAWDFSKDSMMVNQAVQLAPSVHDFVQIFAGSAYVFYAYAQTKDGRLYSWGRNKTCNLGNGVCPLNSHQAATYPNSWDVRVPTEVSPLTVPETRVSSPWCEANQSAANCWCGSGPGDPQNC